jgi:hypothetical protein
VVLLVEDETRHEDDGLMVGAFADEGHEPLDGFLLVALVELSVEGLLRRMGEYLEEGVQLLDITLHHLRCNTGIFGPNVYIIDRRAPACVKNEEGHQRRRGAWARGTSDPFANNSGCFCWGGEEGPLAPSHHPHKFSIITKRLGQIVKATDIR